MPLTKPKGVVENYKPKKHSHTCSKCGKVWPCSLQVDPDDHKMISILAPEKTKLQCWWDDDQDCVRCKVA